MMTSKAGREAKIPNMCWLPCPAAPTGALPLSDSSAAVLCEALLGERDSAISLQHALRLDPPLALGALCHLWHGSKPRFLSVDELATELNQRLPDLLATQVRDQPDQPDSFVRLAVKSILTGRRAAVLARERQPSAVDCAILAGLLHNLPAWMSGRVVDSPKKLSADDLSEMLDPYLALDDAGVAAECVIEALEMDAEDDVEATIVVQEWWAASIPLSHQLPTLARRIARLNRLEAEFVTVLEDEKLQAMYKLAAGAGHEINNPLGSIAGRAQLLLQDETDPERRRMLTKINSQAFRAHEMISDMMLFARPPAPVCQPLTASELIEGVIREMREQSVERGAEIVTGNIDGSATVHADST
ncbi:MAG: HAMP domain-containing histidine kinase, partial [Planctomycetales bacterium]